MAKRPDPNRGPHMTTRRRPGRPGGRLSREERIPQPPAAAWLATAARIKRDHRRRAADLAAPPCDCGACLADETAAEAAAREALYRELDGDPAEPEAAGAAEASAQELAGATLADLAATRDVLRARLVELETAAARGEAPPPAAMSPALNLAAAGITVHEPPAPAAPPAPTATPAATRISISPADPEAAARLAATSWQPSLLPGSFADCIGDRQPLPGLADVADSTRDRRPAAPAAARSDQPRLF